MNKLDEMAKKYNIELDGNKKQRVDKVLSFFESKCLVSLEKKQTQKSANDMDLIDIGRNMRKLLDETNQEDLTHVIMENQISTIATRMKAIQGMLAQYYIMIESKEYKKHIEFISSSNKLKDFDNYTTNLPKNETTQAEKYKQHKKDAINITQKILERNNGLCKEILSYNALNSAKKDDYADCFLQGLYYLRNKNIISYADDLEIKIVV